MLIIESRYNGPPGSGNGGYSAGLFATASGLAAPPGHGAVEVTLRRPPPLDEPLTVTRSGERGAVLSTGDGVLVADAQLVEPFDAAVPPVSWEQAQQASASYPGFTDHPFPTCYVCGPQRPDGLRIFPGQLPDGRTAAPVTVPAGPGPQTVWAMLDCPGGWAVLAPGRPYVLGRMATVLVRLPHVGQRCVAVGRTIGGQGRKAEVHSSLYGPDGGLLAYARATWIGI